MGQGMGVLWQRAGIWLSQPYAGSVPFGKDQAGILFGVFLFSIHPADCRPGTSGIFGIREPGVS